MPHPGGSGRAARLAPAGLIGQVMHDGVMAEPINPGPTGGAVWSRPQEWARRRTPEGCIICASRAPLDIIAELPTAWAGAL